MRFIKPITLQGPQWATLEPLELEHESALIESVEDGDLWQVWYTNVPAPASMRSYLEAALIMREQQGAMPFVVRRQSDQKIVGSTRFFEVDATNRRLEIGHTWYAKSAQRSGINTEVKLLLLTHAFEKLNCIAVEIRTHAFNFASRAAIARLGAHQDGILRNHRICPNGTLRDTVVFSMIESEWPRVKAHLEWQLERPRTTPTTL